jgi:hypothetical protein
MQAAAQRISVLFSSEDDGDEIANPGSRQLDYAASDPFVTAVGGTVLAVGNNDVLEQRTSRQRDLPVLATRRPRPGRNRARLLRPPAQRLEGLRRDRAAAPLPPAVYGRRRGWTLARADAGSGISIAA